MLAGHLVISSVPLNITNKPKQVGAWGKQTSLITPDKGRALIRLCESYRSSTLVARLTVHRLRGIGRVPLSTPPCHDKVSPISTETQVFLYFYLSFAMLHNMKYKKPKLYKKHVVPFLKDSEQMAQVIGITGQGVRRKEYFDNPDQVIDLSKACKARYREMGRILKVVKRLEGSARQYKRDMNK